MIPQPSACTTNVDEHGLSHRRSWPLANKARTSSNRSSWSKSRPLSLGVDETSWRGTVPRSPSFRFRASVRKRTEYALARPHQLNAALLARRLARAGPGHARSIPRRLGRHAGDAHFVQLVERLNLVSPEFAEWWPRHDVPPTDRGPQRLRSSEGRTNDSREH